MDKETAKVVKRFASELRKKFDIEKIILFGSRARGDYFKESDYDFIIVSKDFAEKPMFKRMAEIYKFWKEKRDIEPLCYTPEEFKEKLKHKMFKQALKNGIRIV